MKKLVFHSHKTRQFLVQMTCGAIAGLIILTIFFLLVSLILLQIIKQDHAQDSDNSRRYLTDLSTFLSSEWEIGIPRKERDEDIIGYHRSIIGCSYLNAHHTNNSLAYIRQYVIVYKNISEASKRYAEQQDWIFVRDFGVPPTQQLLSYKELKTSDEYSFHADAYHIGCLNTLTDIRCSGLFQYNNYIVFMDSYPVRDSVRYLTEEELMEIFKLIDETLKSAGET